jgi:hypothetical protein
MRKEKNQRAGSTAGCRTHAGGLLLRALAAAVTFRITGCSHFEF